MRLANPDQIIVTAEEWIGQPVSTLHVHHRHFPEVQAEGMTVQVAAIKLGDQLLQSLEAVSDPWHRETVEQALEDLHAFVAESH